MPKDKFANITIHPKSAKLSAGNFKVEKSSWHKGNVNYFPAKKEQFADLDAMAKEFVFKGFGPDTPIFGDNDKVVTVEGDNTSDLEILPVMLANSKMGFGLVLASVYAQGGGFDKTSAFRKIISFMKKDKKNNTKKINLVLLKKVGSPVHKLQFNEKTINLFLKKELTK